MNNSENCRFVGRIAGLWRYPVKSMGGEALSEADISWHGVAGDRRWSFIRNDSKESGFPWFTLRERGDMSHFRPSFVEPGRPEKSPLRVKTPTGTFFDVADPALGEQLLPGGARVIKQDRGVFDTFPLSLITTQTIDRLANTVGTHLDVQRFRPNLLIDASGEAPFPEDSWVGSALRIGPMRMRIDKRDGRCLVITIDPDSGERSPEILRAVAQGRQGCLGVYGSTVEPGQVQLGDEVFIEGAAEPPVQ